MSEERRDYRVRVQKVFSNFENMVTIALSVLVGLMVLLTLLKILQQLYGLATMEYLTPGKLQFTDYQDLFGKILILLIGLAFLSSILKALDTHEVRVLVQDVALIAALAVSRKLIMYDYDHRDPLVTLALGGLLAPTKLFYWLIRVGGPPPKRVPRNL